MVAVVRLNEHTVTDTSLNKATAVMNTHLPDFNVTLGSDCQAETTTTCQDFRPLTVWARLPFSYNVVLIYLKSGTMSFPLFI